MEGALRCGSFTTCPGPCCRTRLLSLKTPSCEQLGGDGREDDLLEVPHTPGKLDDPDDPQMPLAILIPLANFAEESLILPSPTGQGR